MNTIEDLLTENRFEKRSEKPIISIEDIEAILNMKLPDDYKLFLFHYLPKEFYVGSNYISLWAIEELLILNNSYGILDNLPNTLAIGSNGGGEFIAIEFNENSSFRIILSPFIDLDKQCHIEIGKSFMALFMDKEKQKFLNS